MRNESFHRSAAKSVQREALNDLPERQDVRHHLPDALRAFKDVLRGDIYGLHMVKNILPACSDNPSEVTNVLRKLKNGQREWPTRLSAATNVLHGVQKRPARVEV